MSKKKRKKRSIGRLKGSGPAVCRPFEVPGGVVHLIACVLLVGLVMLAYSNNYRNPFVFDDISKIIQNPRIHSLAKALPDEPSGYLTSQRWVVDCTLALNFRTSRHEVWSYHLLSNLFHAANAVLVYFIVLMLLRRHGAGEPLLSGGIDGVEAEGRGGALARFLRNGKNLRMIVAWVAAALFALHRVQTQAVTYVIQRSELLATFFFVASFMLYMKYADRERLDFKGGVLCLVMSVVFLFAIGSKPYVIVLPAVILMYEFIFKAEGRFKPMLARLKALAAPFLITAAMAVYSASGMLHSQVKTGYEYAGFSIRSISPHEYLFTQFRVIMTYFRLLFVPVRLNLDYDYAVERSFFSADVLVSFAVLLAIGVAAILLIRRNPIVSFFAFWFFFVLGPTSSFVPIVDVIFEHRLYLPSVAFCSVAIIAVSRLLVRWPRAMCVFLAVLLALHGYGTFARNRIWRSALSLWQDIVEKSPNKGRGHNTLSQKYLEAGLNSKDAGKREEYFDLAMEHLKKALRINPNYTEAHNNLGVMLGQKGDREKDLEDLNVSRGNKEMEAGNREKAIAFYDKAAEHGRKATGYYTEAIKHYERSREIDPYFYTTYVNLARQYLMVNRRGKAVKVAKEGLERITRETVRKRPGEIRGMRAALYYTLGYIYEHNAKGERYREAADLEKAKEAYKEAIRLKRNYADAYYNLAVVYQFMGDFEQAISNMERSLRYGKQDPKAEKAREVIKRWKRRLEKE